MGGQDKAFPKAGAHSRSTKIRSPGDTGWVGCGGSMSASQKR